MLNEQVLVNQYLKQIDRKLFIQLYDRQITPLEAAEKTKGYDIDTANYSYSSFLAKLGMITGFSGFRTDLIPRLKGLFSYHQTRRAVNRAKYRKLIDILNHSGIGYLAGYCLSLETKYCITGFQIQYIFDIIVHEEDFEEAKKLTANDEKTFNTVIVKCSDPGVWDSAIETVCNGQNIRVLSPNGMVLVYAEKAITHPYSFLFDERGSMSTKLLWLYSFRAIDAQEGGVDPGKLRTLCEGKDRKLYYTVRFLLACAFTYYGLEDRLKKLDEEMPVDKDYLRFLYMTKVLGRCEQWINLRKSRNSE